MYLREAVKKVFFGSAVKAFTPLPLELYGSRNFNGTVIKKNGAAFLIRNSFATIKISKTPKKLQIFDRVVKKPLLFPVLLFKPL